MNNYPLISIIVCVLNRENDIKILLESISSISYPNYEALIVDNGSSDRTCSIINDYIANNNKILFVDASSVLGSPYSARNMGIKKSKGDFLAFIDGYPDKHWLTELMSFSKEENIDIISGKIKFPVTSEKDIYNLYDSIFSLDTEHTVKKYKSAPTGNLLIKKSIFNDIGLFKENIRSGGDILFTSQATKKGYTIGFCSTAISIYYTRNKSQLIEKQKRVALGQVGIWFYQNRNIKIEILKNIIRFFILTNPLTTIKRINKNNLKIKKTTYIKLYIIQNYLEKIRIYHCLKNVIRQSKNEKNS